MYKVTNKTDGVKKYRDTHSGRDVVIQAGESMETEYPPIESSVFSVTNIEKKEEKKINTKEDKNGSNSSRRRMDGDLSDSDIKARRS